MLFWNVFRDTKTIVWCSIFYIDFYSTLVLYYINSLYYIINHNNKLIIMNILINNFKNDFTII